MVDTTSNVYLNILLPAKDGAVYVDSYGNTYSQYAPNYNANDPNVVCFQESGITLSVGESAVSKYVKNVKFYYREVGATTWTCKDFSSNPLGSSDTSGKISSLTQEIWSNTNSSGKPFHELITDFKLFTQYEWYIYAEYHITYDTSYGKATPTRTDNVLEKIDVKNTETSVYKLTSHVRRCIFIPKTTNGSVRARVNNANTEVYPAFTYSNDRGSTETAKFNINGTVSKVPLVSSDNPLAGRLEIQTKSGRRHFGKRDPSMRDSGIGWTSYGEKYGAYYEQYGSNTPYSYQTGYRQDRTDTLYYYRYLYYNVVDNKAYSSRQEYKEYYNTDKNYAGNYNQYWVSQYYVIDSYGTSSYTAYDKQYNYTYIRNYNITGYRINYGVDSYYYYWAQYRYGYTTEYYYRYSAYYERTYSYPLYYQYTDNRYSRVDNAIQYYYRETRTATGSKNLSLTVRNIRYHSSVSSTTKQYYANAPDSGGASYVLGNYLFRQGNYTGYYYTWTYNPTFYVASTTSYTFTYNYTYNRTDTLPKYYTYYRLDSSTTAYAPNGQYAWNYVTKYRADQTYKTQVQYHEPVYSSQTQVTKYKITGYQPSSYSITYATGTKYDGARTNYSYYVDRTHRVDTYRQDLVLQKYYYYSYYWTGSYYHTYPSGYRYDRSAYYTTYNQYSVYGYKYNANYTLSRYYKNYYKAYLNRRQ